MAGDRGGKVMVSPIRRPPGLVILQESHTGDPPPLTEDVRENWKIGEVMTGTIRAGLQLIGT